MARDIHPTNHLLEKMASRDITWAEIVDTVNNPKVVYGPDYKGRKNFQKGDICVIVDHDGAVITALLASEKQWEDEEVRNRKGKRNG